MNIVYENKFKDQLHFIVYHSTRQPSLLIMFAIFVIASSIMSDQMIPWVITGIKRVLSLVIVEGIFLVISLILVFGIQILGNVSKMNKGFLTTHNITISDNGFVEETAFNRTETKWEGIMKIAKSRRYIFVYLSQHGAHVIPRRAFANDSEWELLYQKLMTYTTQKNT